MDIDLLQDIFPYIDKKKIKEMYDNKQKNMRYTVDALLKYMQSENDKQIAEELAQNFAEIDDTPKCTKNPSCYQLFVVDQVSARKE